MRDTGQNEIQVYPSIPHLVCYSEVLARRQKKLKINLGGKIT